MTSETGTFWHQVGAEKSIDIEEARTVLEKLLTSLQSTPRASDRFVPTKKKAPSNENHIDEGR